MNAEEKSFWQSTYMTAYSRTASASQAKADADAALKAYREANKAES